MKVSSMKKEEFRRLIINLQEIAHEINQIQQDNKAKETKKK